MLLRPEGRWTTGLVGVCWDKSFSVRWLTGLAPANCREVVNDQEDVFCAFSHEHLRLWQRHLYSHGPGTRDMYRRACLTPTGVNAYNYGLFSILQVWPMIRSMTAFGSARSESPAGSVSVEFRSVNSRFLDVNLRLPDDLRMAESMVRELLGQSVKRGKVEVRVSFQRKDGRLQSAIDPDFLATTAQHLQQARQFIPDIPAPRLAELINGTNGDSSPGMDPDVWLPMCQEAITQALADLQAAREREGQRLAETMLAHAREIAGIVDDVESGLPTLLAEHQEKISNRLREALQAASPDGFALITGQELSARIAQEASLFGLRIDVAEELTRLRSHIAELQHILQTGEAAAGKTRSSGSAGKRLDFLFQEMNREANTLGSKAGGLSVTRAAIDLKLLIEQMREQAQNIE